MIRSRGKLLFVAASVLALACGLDSTAPSVPSLTPSATASTSTGTSGANGTRGWWAGDSPSPLRCSAHAPIVARGTFGPSGGMLVVGQSYLVIPGGALLDRVTITATAVGDNSSTINFQPEGLHFRKSASLIISSAGCNVPSGATPGVVYLSHSGEILERIPAYFDPRWRLVVAPIQHFSGYAIAF